MSELETFSRYLNDLTKEGKFENVIINFQDNAQRFSKQDISDNHYLVYNVLHAFRETGRVTEGLAFFNQHEIKLSGNRRIILSTLGWLIYDGLKNELINPSDQGIAYESKALDILPLLDLADEKEQNLFKFLFSAVLRLEKKSSRNDLEIVFRVFKDIDLRNNESAQTVIRSSDYIIPFILDIFRKNQKYKWAESFMGFIGITQINDHPAFFNSYGWLLYGKLKMQLQETGEEIVNDEMNSFLYDFDSSGSPFTDDINAVIEQVKLLIPILNRYDKYSPYSKLFQLILKAEKKKANPDWRAILTFLDSIDPAALTLDCESIEFEKGGRMKTIELASDRELWYSNRVNALYKLGEFEQCVEVIDKAKREIPKLHYGYDVWFQWRIAQCMKEFGKFEEAKAEVEQVLKKKKEWFVQKELAELCYKLGDKQNALKMGIESALSFGDREKKDSLYFLLGEVLQANGKMDLAAKHYGLAKLIRESQQWKVPQKYMDALSQQGIAEIGVEKFTLNPLFRDLTNYWRSSGSEKQAPRATSGGTSNPAIKTGAIKNLNIERGFGFIAGDDSTDYYFKVRNAISPIPELRLKRRVSFELEPSRGDSKDRATKVKVLTE